MTEDVQADHTPAAGRRWAWAAVAAVVLLAAVLVVPPMVSINRYKSRITQLIASSLGRPVRLSSVELRLLPWPGFVLSDLSVASDPAYGAEPVLHASSVTASIRLLPLWRGRLEIGSISVDEASLNLVRSGPGRWNLDPLFRTAAAQAGSAEKGANPHALPYLEATNSRVNIKDGAEKLPFSLVNARLQFWEENPGEWHIRVRGQPARTDVPLYQEDTGIVRLEATVRRAPALRQMPVHLDLDWQQAQLGQLARLVSGSDPGWRGDLTGELHVDGTADAAQVAIRLRATGVHRAEFAPAEPMDFDANCGLVYHYSRRVLENLACDSPLGDGHIHMTGAIPHAGAPLELTVALDRVPVAAGLDVLRIFRSNLPPGLEAGGAISGKIAYAASPASQEPQPPARPEQERLRKPAQPAPGPLSGFLTVNDFELSGAGLNRPIQIARIELEPADISSGNGNPAEALEGTASIPAGGTAPLSLHLRLQRTGYLVTLRGQASLPRAREVLRAAGLEGMAGLDAMAGEPLSMDLTAEGPWLPPEEVPFAAAPGPPGPDGEAPAQEPESAVADSLSGTVTLREANWKADFLAHQVEIPEATLLVDRSGFRWDPIQFAYGPVKGTASLTVPESCLGPEPCLPQFQLRFGNLDAATLQTAILGVREKGTLFSALIDRLHPSSAPPWPKLEGSVQADSLVLGPVTLRQPQATLRVLGTGAEISHLEAGILGGRLEGSGTFDRAENDEDKPAYTLDCRLKDLNAQAVGRLVGQSWSGGSLMAEGKLELSGYTDKDLAASAKGSLHFEWRHGTVTAKSAGGSQREAVPTVLAHFDLWTADAAIADGTMTLEQNQVQGGARSHSVQGAVTFGDPPELSFAAGNQAKPAGAVRASTAPAPGPNPPSH